MDVGTEPARCEANVLTLHFKMISHDNDDDQRREPWMNLPREWIKKKKQLPYKVCHVPDLRTESSTWYLNMPGGPASPVFPTFRRPIRNAKKKVWIEWRILINETIIWAGSVSTKFMKVDSNSWSINQLFE